jgi:hypothetical protein
MAKKLTGEEVGRSFEEAGYTLLGEYVDNRTPVAFLCDKGHERVMTLSSLKAGKRCGECCAKNKPNDPERIQAIVEGEGYTMLTPYTTSKSLFGFICPAGHSHQITWHAFQSGKRCAFCRHPSKKLDPSLVKEAVEGRGYKALSSYVNAKVPLLLECSQGHKFSMKWQYFNSGYNCPECAINRPKTLEEIKAALAVDRHELVSEYETGRKFTARCPNSHLWETDWGHFQGGKRCSFCAGNKRKLHEDVAKAFAKEGYILTSEYKNSQTPVEFICPKGHKHKISYSGFIHQRQRCGVCHTEDYYKVFTNAIFSRVVNSIKYELKRQKDPRQWDAIYSKEFIKELSMKVLSIYSKTTRGCAVDHIVPISKFNVLNRLELMACWNPKNLRYLDALKNISRHNRMTEDEIRMMRFRHPDIINAASRLNLGKEIYEQIALPLFKIA